MSLDHKIIWNELHVPDLVAANEFYGPLFGWSTKPEECDTYVHFYHGGETVAGYMAPHGGPGSYPHWHVYLGTSDIEAYVKRAEKAGGKSLMPVMDIPHTGKIGAIADPGGAVLSPFQVADPERSSWGHGGTAGKFCWVELLTQDETAAKDFYTKVVGWELMEAEFGGTQYCMLMPPGASPDQAQGGIMQMDNPEVPDNWLPYVCVEDVEATAAKVKELGGTICVPPATIGTHGKIAVLIDPQKAVLGIYQSLGTDC
ncbi:MAG: VOC family protein [Planctomycetota bacterium]|nr:VOC family protein [Planctomycetota bacterium]